MKKIILASASRRRHNLLKQAGIPFEVMVSHFEESIDEELSPYDLVKLLSEKKAYVVAELVKRPCIIIAADTIVSFDGKVMGKPKDEAHARTMLQTLQGKKHTVYTGVTILDKDKNNCHVKHIIDNTDVYMRKLSDEEICAYVKTGEPFDKAGGYAIQEKGSLFIDKIEGDYYTVVGLPLVSVSTALHEFGFNFLEAWNK